MHKRHHHDIRLIVLTMVYHDGVFCSSFCLFKPTLTCPVKAHFCGSVNALLEIIDELHHPIGLLALYNILKSSYQYNYSLRFLLQSKSVRSQNEFLLKSSTAVVS